MNRRAVRLTPAADQDLERLFDFLVERELRSSAGDPQVALAAMEALRTALQTLAHSPHLCRQAPERPGLRELVIPFGRAGYVTLFEIRESEVVVARVRHQREYDYR